MAGGHHTGCSPTLLLMGSAWLRGDTMPCSGRRRGDRTPANAPTCIAPASSRAPALLQTQQPAGSSRARAHPPPEPEGAGTAGESRQPCKQPGHGATGICWAPCGLESVGNLIRLCDMAELFRHRAAGGLSARGGGEHSPVGSTASALPEDADCCRWRTSDSPLPSAGGFLERRIQR